MRPARGHGRDSEASRRPANDLWHFAEPVTDLPRIDVSADPSDNCLLAMTDAGRADYLGTADKRDCSHYANTESRAS
jgi:hypothetical protein